MAARNENIKLIAGEWTEITDNDIFSLTFQNRGTSDVVLMGSVDQTQPTRAVDGEDGVLFSPNEASIATPLSKLFPSIIAKRVFARSLSRDGLVYVDHSGTDDPTIPEVVTFPSVQRDGFGRIRMSMPYKLFDSKQIHDAMPLFWDSAVVSGSGTSAVHSVLKASTTLSVSASTAGHHLERTFQRFNYPPGISVEIMLTGTLILDNGGAGIESGMGYVDDENGLFVVCVDGVVSMGIKSNVTGTPTDDLVAQSAWNGDKLDGSGKSGITLTAENSEIWWTDFEWLGVGDVRMGFVIDGQFILCHTFHNANENPNVYMSTPNLPVSYWIKNDGTGAAASLQRICSTVIAEGISKPLGANNGVSTGATSLTATTSGQLYALVGVRLKTGYIGKQIDFKSLSVICTTADDFEFVLLFNPTVAGTFTYADMTESAMQYAIGATANTVTGGRRMAGAFAVSGKDGGASGEALDNAIHLGSAIDGTLDTAVLCVRGLGASAVFHGSLDWLEVS